jgi:hypothetical protein
MASRPRLELSKKNDVKLIVILNVENRIREFALLVDNLMLPIMGNGSPAVYLGEKHFGIERELCIVLHSRLSLRRLHFKGRYLTFRLFGTRANSSSFSSTHEYCDAQIVPDVTCQLAGDDDRAASDILDARELLPGFVSVSDESEGGFECAELDGDLEAKQALDELVREWLTMAEEAERADR